VRRVCIYHAGCPDGFGAAWAAWRAWGEDALYVPRSHDDALAPSEYAGDSVLFADIAPPQHAWKGLAEETERLVVLDHHVSARDRYLSDPALAASVADHGHHVVFDLAHSGAVLAWQHLHPGVPLPPLLAYIEDQDLWRFQLPASREVNAAISSHLRSFETWSRLAAAKPEALAAEGTPILRALRMEVDRALATAHPVRVGALVLEAVNARLQRAEIGHELAERRAFGTPAALVYRLSGERVDVSLYSVGDFDVARLAAGFGGGGHRNAAGFSVTLAEWARSFVSSSAPRPGGGTRPAS
jgi:oligoribonuclease NrnB/cAMP/cGMP phosphodiesterase (DHH superfamily)